MTPQNLPACDLRKLVEAHIRSIHNTLKPGVKGFMPTLMVESWSPEDPRDKRDTVIIMLADIDMEDHDAKREAMRKCGQKFYELRRIPLGVAFASEAWISQQLHTQPRNADDRREVLFIHAQSICKEVEPLFEMMEIKRDKKQHIQMGTFVSRSDGATESPLIDAFFGGFFSEFLEQQRSGLT